MVDKSNGRFSRILGGARSAGARAKRGLGSASRAAAPVVRKTAAGVTRGARRAGSGLGSAARAAAPVVGRAASGVTRGAAGVVGVASQAKGALVAGAAAGVGAVGAVGITKSVKNKGFILFLAGWLMFLVMYVFGIQDYYYTVSLFLMVYTAFIVFEKKGLVFVLAFLVWYLYFKAPVGDNLQYPLFSIVALIIVLHGLINKFSNQEGFVSTIKEDIIYGGGLALIFLVDIGAVDILKDLGVPVPNQITALTFLIPLWAYVGLFVMISEKEEQASTWITKILGFLSILYLVLIIPFFGLSSDAYGQDSFLPGPEKLLEAKQEAFDQLPKTENPAISNLWCMVNEPTNIGPCITKRQEDSLIKATCKQSDLVRSGIQTQAECIAEERERLEDEKTKVSGAEDTTISEKTEAKFEISDYVPTTAYRREGDDTITSYPIGFEMENPRYNALSESNNNVKAEFSCHFEQGNEEIVSGTVLPERIAINSRRVSNTVICTPDEQLEGSYTLVMAALISNLESSTKLSRIIVGEKSNAWMEEWSEQLIGTHCPRGCVSLAPNEPGIFNFAIGKTFDDPILRAGDTLFLAASIEKGDFQGELVNINAFELDLGELNYYVDNPSCLSGQNLAVEDGELLHLPTCTFDQLGPEYTDLGDDYLNREFRGWMNYDISLKREIRNIEVEVVT